VGCQGWRSACRRSQFSPSHFSFVFSHRKQIDTSDIIDQAQTIIEANGFKDSTLTMVWFA
jgi:hypothetical protein